MVASKLWWVTRPTRDLRDLQLALQSFAGLARGKRWRGNQQLQTQFEKENSAKTTHVGSYGSGGRTWAALLRMWGLWYDDRCVTLTSAGDVILSSSEHVYPQITRLIMNFQITSAYSEHQKLDPDFRIFPFRFMLKLMLDARIKYLEEDEIALFLLQVKNSSQYENAVQSIIKYRSLRKKDEKRLNERKDLIATHMRTYRAKKRKDSPTDVDGHWKFIKDIANTLVNNIRFLQYIKYDPDDGTIRIRGEQKSEVESMLEEYERDNPFSTLYNISEKAFYEHYGLRYDRNKASRKETKPKTHAQKQYDRIKNALGKIKKTDADLSGSFLIEAIQIITNDQRAIERIISKYPELSSQDHNELDPNYVDYYLQCARSGKDEDEFESMTRDIFTKMGLETKKHKIRRKTGAGHPEIDGLILNKLAMKSGLLECKSGAKYTFPIGDCEKMKRVYIPNFRERTVDGKTYSLEYFTYVVGNQASGLPNFRDIIAETHIDGSVVYAEDLIKIYSLFKSAKVSAEDIWPLFSRNKHLTWKDIDDFS